MSFVEVLLSAVADEITVGHVGSMAHEYVLNGVPFLRSLNIAPYRIITDDLKLITPEFDQRLKKSSLRPGDVVIVRTGKPGTAAVIPPWLERANCSDLVIVRCGPRIDPKYLTYWVNSLASHHIGSNLVGAVQQHFNVGAARLMPILLPSIADQALILSVLAALDEKIDLNRRTNETLEAMAQAIFRDWFIDFGPVRRKQAGVTDPVEIMGCVPKDAAQAAKLAAMFPDRLNSDELPVGWSVGRLVDVTSQLRRGISPKYSADSGVVVLNQKCIRDHEVSVAPARLHDASIKPVEGRTLFSGDILVNSTGVGTLGRVAQIWGVSEPIIVDSHVTVVRADTSKVSPLYLGLAVGLSETEIEMLGEGSTGQTELSRQRLGQLPILLPPRPVVEAFDRVCGPLSETIQSNRNETAVLAETRDYLLPRLMSGSVRVGAAAESDPQSSHGRRALTDALA